MSWRKMYVLMCLVAWFSENAINCKRLVVDSFQNPQPELAGICTEEEVDDQFIIAYENEEGNSLNEERVLESVG